MAQEVINYYQGRLPFASRAGERAYCGALPRRATNEFAITCVVRQAYNPLDDYDAYYNTSY
jgi:hypothetical protein